MVKRPLPDFSLSMESLHNAVGGSRKTFLLFLLVSSLVQASTLEADSTCRYGVWGVPSASSSTTVGRFGLPSKDKALSVRGGESSEEDKLLEEDGEEDEMHPDEDEIVDIEVNELMDEEEQIMEELEETDGGVDDWAGDEDDADDDDVNAELIEEMNEVTGQFDEDEDDLDTTQDGDNTEVAAVAKGFAEEANTDTLSVEPEKTWETPESSFSREAAVDDGDSSAFVDRMELADAYDEGDTTSGGFEGENNGDGSGIGSVAPGGDTGTEEGAQESASSAVAEQQVSSETQEEAQESTSSTVAEQQASAAPAPPTEISAATKGILMKELKYRRSEVEKMRPDVAKIAADKRLQRPTEGVPLNWFVTSKVPKRNGLLKALPKILVPVLVGALAVTTGISFDLSPSSVLPSKPKPPKPSLFAEYEISTPTEDAVEVDDGDTKATDEPESEPDALPVNEYVNAPSKVHAHSIKPGQRSATDVLDVTWLDRGITAIERVIKAFLGWEI
jgi:hypothetical protein